MIEDGEDPPNPWRGYKKCLSNLPEMGHVAVLQDDVTVCRNFVPALEIIATHNPHTPVSLFLSKTPKRTYNMAMLKWGKTRYVINHQMDVVHVVGMLWPVDTAREFMEWIKDNQQRMHGDAFTISDDANVTRWMKFSKQSIRCTVPSLVQHLDDVPSIVNGDKVKNGADLGRTTSIFIGDADPLELDWSR